MLLLTVMKEFNEASFVDVPLDDWTAAALLTAAVPLERAQGATTAGALPEGLYSLYTGRYSSKLLVQRGKFRYQATEVKHHMHFMRCMLALMRCMLTPMRRMPALMRRMLA